jgi:hypothetical protein
MDEYLVWVTTIISLLVLLQYLGAWWLKSGGVAARLQRLSDPDYVPGWLFLLGQLEGLFRRKAPRLLGDPDPLPRVRHPVALIWTAARRLWRNRSLAVWVLALWVISALLSGLWIDPVMRHRLEPAPCPPMSGERMGTRSSGSFGRVEGGRNFQYSLQIALTQLSRSPLDLSAGWTRFQLVPATLTSPALLALGVGLLVLRRRRPWWLSPGLRRRCLTAGLVAVFAGIASGWYYYGTVFWPPRFSGIQLRGAWSYVEVLLITSVGVVVVAPATVLQWSLTWQIAQGRRWSWREMLRDVVRYWFPAGLCAVMLALPLGVTLLWLPPVLGSPLGLVLSALVLFLPWALLGEGVSLGAVLARVVALWRQRWGDLGMFALRYWAVTAWGLSLLGALQELFPGHGIWAIGHYPLAAATMLVRWAFVMATAVAYLELRKGERAEEAMRVAASPAFPLVP